MPGILCLKKPNLIHDKILNDSPMPGYYLQNEPKSAHDCKGNRENQHVTPFEIELKLVYHKIYTKSEQKIKNPTGPFVKTAKQETAPIKALI